ncbi:hypothetical protein D3C85_1576190 [compost metagenome]
MTKFVQHPSNIIRGAGNFVDRHIAVIQGETVFPPAIKRLPLATAIGTLRHQDEHVRRVREFAGMCGFVSINFIDDLSSRYTRCVRIISLRALGGNLDEFH